MEISSQHPTEKPVQSSCHTAVSTPLQPPPVLPMVPTLLRHQLHHQHHHCQFTASLEGRRCPHSCVTTVQEAGAAPSPHRVPGCLLGNSGKFVPHASDCFSTPCGNTTRSVSQHHGDSLQSELDKRGPFPSEGALGRDREGSSSHPFLVSQAGESLLSARAAKN